MCSSSYWEVVANDSLVHLVTNVKSAGPGLTYIFDIYD